MSNRRYLLIPLAALAIVVVAQAVSGAGPGEAGPDRGGPHSALAADPIREAVPPLDVTAPFAGLASADTERALTFWQARLRTEPRSDQAYVYLGELYALRGRETGDAADVTRAEEAFGAALAIAPRNLQARAGRARILATLHRFAEARREALEVLAEDPAATGLLGVVADASLETGDLDAAEVAVRLLEQRQDGPPVAARRARLAFLKGDTATAARLMTEAAEQAADGGETGIDLAFYHYASGEYGFLKGDLDAADAAYERALSAFPGHHLATAGRGRVAFARGDLAKAIGFYESAVASVPRPESLAYLGDLQALAGDAAAAEAQYASVDFIGDLSSGAAQGATSGGALGATRDVASGARLGVYDRELSLFLASHRRDTARAVRLAEAELRERKDVYGWDALAWALHADGRHAEALSAMDSALATGTRDARLFYHAGMIEIANGLVSDGRAHLAAALDLNAGFDPLGAREAREELDQ